MYSTHQILAAKLLLRLTGYLPQRAIKQKCEFVALTWKEALHAGFGHSQRCLVSLTKPVRGVYELVCVHFSTLLFHARRPYEHCGLLCCPSAD